MNTKSPTSVASEPIYLTPKSYFGNQSQASESTNSIVMLNLDESVRPSSAPNYCSEDEKITSTDCNVTTSEQQQLINQIQNENSKDSGIFMKDNVTVNSQQLIKSSSTLKEDARQSTGDDVTDHAMNRNITTLIINVNEEPVNDQMKENDIQSISTLIENGDLIVEDRTPTKNTTQFIRQAPGSTGNNIAPPSYAMKSDEIKAQEQETNETKKGEAISQPSKSRISNIRDQFEQTTTSIHKPKIKLKNFKIGSYSTNHTEEDIYSDKSSYSLENARQANVTNQKQSYFRYLSSPIEMNKEQKSTDVNLERSHSNSSQTSASKPAVPIKKPNLNAIKFNEVSLNEGKCV